MSVLFTDSNCELNWNEIERLNIQYISMPYAMNGEEFGFDMGKTHDYKSFFNKIRNGIMPSTMALNPQNYIDIFEPFLKSGEDILYIHFSSKMSGTFEFMNKAISELKKKYPKRSIKTVDTLSISMGAGIVVYEASKLHNNGASDNEVIAFVKEFREKVCCMFTVDNLMHLKKGGRISGVSAFFGSMLNIKPILSINNEGKIVNVEKVQGKKKAHFTMVKKLKEIGDDLSKYPIIILHADCEDDAEELKMLIKKEVGNDTDIWVQPVGPTVGTHCGPGTLGLIFHSTQRF
ncbi:MAG: DegV family protein [Clostridia bacterium]